MRLFFIIRQNLARNYLHAPDNFSPHSEYKIGIFMAASMEITLAFIGGAVQFLPLFVFLPKLIQQAMEADTDVVIEAFGMNGQMK